jgi:PmbA protein
MLKSKEYLENLAQKCIEKSKTLGATDVEVALSNSISESLNSRNKKIEHSERSEVLSLGLTTYINKKKSNVSSSNLNKENLFTLIARCVDCTKVSPEDKYVGLPDKNMMQDKFEDLELYDEKKLSNSFKNEFLKTVEEEMFKNKKIKNSNGSSFSESKSNFIYANSNGFCNGYKTSSYSVFCEALAEENGSMERDYEVSISRFFENIDKPDFIGKSAAERATKRLGARKIKSEKLPVIFDKRISKSLLSTFASAVSASNFVRKVSFLKDSKNKKIFNDKINIIDNPAIKRGLGSQLFDGEGVASNNLVIVKKGVLKEIFLDNYNSKILKTQTNGRCGGPTNLFIENGEYEIEKMISDQKKALFVTELIGRAGDITNGNYSVGASGLMIENGEIVYPVNEITLAGDLKDIFLNLIPANNLEMKYSTNSPALLIEQMMIAGK